MELSLNFEQLKLKSEYLNTNPRCIHYHENCGNPLFITWSGCVTVIYSLKNLTEVTLWDPIEPLILPVVNPIISVLTFNSKIYCVDNIGTIYHLKQVQRDSPDLFDCSSPTQVFQQPLFYNYEWISLYSQKSPCNIFKAICFSDGIALVATLDEWIILQFLRVNVNDNNEPIIFNYCNKQIRLQKKFPFTVCFFISCTWRDWFSNTRAIELFGPNVLDSKDIFIIATEECKIYSATSDIISKDVTLFSNCPQKIVHIQFNDFDSKKIILVSSSGIVTVMHCIENIPSSFIYLTVTKVDTAFIVDYTVIISNGINLFLITLDKQFSKIVKQVVTPLRGVLTLHRYQFNNIIAITQLNKVYTLSLKYEITQNDEPKFKFNEKSILKYMKDLCKTIESLEEQHEKMNKYIHAVSIVARKDLVAQHCSVNVLIYSDTKALKLGANQNEYIFAIRLSTDCSWLSFSSTIWKLIIRVTDNKKSSSNCGLYSFNVNQFDNNHPVTVKHCLSSKLAEYYASGIIYLELVCQIQNEFINNFLVIPLYPIKLNSLYFVKVEKQEKVQVVNALENRQKYVFKYPENLSLTECITMITNKNKHRISKSLYKNIIDNISKTHYFNYFGKIVSVVFDNKVANNIVLECIDQGALIAVRNGVVCELSNDEPAIIKYSILADVQKQLCLLEELSITDQNNKKKFEEIKNNIKNQISIYLPV